MPDVSQTEPRFFVRLFSKWRSIARWISRYAAIEIAVFFSLAIAAYFLGRDLFDLTVPVDGDVRSHIFKIEVLHSYLAQLSWPQWIPYWYHGIPLDQYYPPGFYFLSALLTFIVGSGVVAYKVLFLLTMMLNGIAVFYFARRFLQFSPHLAIWCLIAYLTSTPLLINYMYGEGPNLLGWSASLGFLTVYLGRITENRTSGWYNWILPGLMLGVAILIHPFPVLFVFIAVALFHIIWLAHRRSLKEFIRLQLPYIAAVFGLGAVTGMYYWLPAMITLNYSSSIYSFTTMMWPGGIIFLLAIIFLSLTIGIILRLKIHNDISLDWLIAVVCISSALGFGGTYYLPFNLGALVQEFRFATIILPLFGFLLIVMPLKYNFRQLSTGKLALALFLSLFLAAFIFGLDKREAIASGFKEISEPGLAAYYKLIAGQFSAQFPYFVVSFFPVFVVLVYLALSVGRQALNMVHNKSAGILAGGVCLIIMTSVIPYINTGQAVNLSRLSTYIDYYRQPEYAEILEAVEDGRLLIPPGKGYLVEGDSFVTFAWHWGVNTVNGPYNQGDPKFFKFTVHLEWEERWLNYSFARENLMHESAAKYIFIRGAISPPSNINGMTRIVQNDYGKLLEINQEIAHANRVTPVLLDVKDPRAVTEFFNILLPKGYRMVLVNVNEIPPDLADKFDYVMLEDKSKIDLYPGRTVFLLNDTEDISVAAEGNIVKLDLPYANYSNRFFYHGDEANGYMWTAVDSWNGVRIYPQYQLVLQNAGSLMSGYLNTLEYSPAGYNMTDNKIELDTSPGFTLVKDSYFPYWKPDQGTVVTTTQGFMLVYSEDDNVILDYRKPAYYTLAAVCTIAGLSVLVLLLIIGVIFPSFRKG